MTGHPATGAGNALTDTIRAGVRWFRRRNVQHAMVGYLFILPVIIGFVVFTAGPIVASFYYSFNITNVISPPRWVGLDNYARMLDDDLFYRAVKVSASFALIQVPLSLALALLVAVVLNQNISARNVYRTIYYLPAVCSTVAVAMVWLWLYHPEFGILNYFLSLAGIQKQMWLSSTKTALPSLIIIAIWGSVGPRMVMYLAGLQGIPDSLFEVAEIDGAGRWQRFRHITLPLISPTTFFLLVTGVIGALQTFELSYVGTGGGPAYATYTIGLYIYEAAFAFGRMGYADAMAYVLAIVVFAITAVQFAVQRRWVFYE